MLTNPAVLGLKVASHPSWAEDAKRDLDSVLLDHAHCEMKAAANAMSLAARPAMPLEHVRVLSDLAREEIDHFQRVVEFLGRRGLSLGPPPVDTYAAELRRVVKALPADPRISGFVDRLLVAALIEARSCERFKLLLSVLSEEADAELFAFYTELFAAEAKHYQLFVDLAIEASGTDEAAVRARLSRVAEAEADVVRALPRATGKPTVHG